MITECSVHLPGCHIEAVRYEGSTMAIEAETDSIERQCPSCKYASKHIHSYRVRQVRDLPVSAYSVHLKIRIKRYRCQQDSCSRQTWTEEVPDIVTRYKRRTKRLTSALWHIGQALGGNPGSHLAHQLRMPTSRDTLLRILRASKGVRPNENPQIVGIDDWAKKKGQTYGTILVDLEHHRVLDLLPDRKPETVAAWFDRHAQPKIVVRDRSAQYAQGVRLGAPGAIQVADRWHLLKNLWDVVERCLRSYQSSQEIDQITPTQAGHRDRFPRSGPEEEQLQLRYQRRVQHHHLIHDLHQRGYSTRRIAKLVGVSRGTVFRYLAVAQLPPPTARPKPSKLDPYLPYLKERIAQGCTHTPILWQEIREQGYPGSKVQLDKWLRLQRRQQAHPNPPSDDPSTQVAHPAPRTATRLLLSDTQKLNDTDQHHLSLMLQDEPLQTLHQHAQQFITMGNNRQSPEFDDWLQKGLDSSFSAYRYFIQSLLKDYDAVKAALDLPWSNGQTEGQIHRLKLLKRQMYGRAKLDLLRIRLTYSPKLHHICV
ncbi:MAG: ISL3 family transposase [Chloroflexota bacterium]